MIEGRLKKQQPVYGSFSSTHVSHIALLRVKHHLKQTKIYRALLNEAFIKALPRSNPSSYFRLYVPEIAHLHWRVSIRILYWKLMYLLKEGIWRMFRIDLIHCSVCFDVTLKIYTLSVACSGMWSPNIFVGLSHWNGIFLRII